VATVIDDALAGIQSDDLLGQVLRQQQADAHRGVHRQMGKPMAWVGRPLPFWEQETNWMTG
jgi:hypothetical protein